MYSLFPKQIMAFPEVDTQRQEFYLQRRIEKERAELFREQPQIDSREDLLTGTGIQPQWV